MFLIVRFAIYKFICFEQSGKKKKQVRKLFTFVLWLRKIWCHNIHKTVTCLVRILIIPPSAAQLVTTAITTTLQQQLSICSYNSSNKNRMWCLDRNEWIRTRVLRILMQHRWVFDYLYLGIFYRILLKWWKLIFFSGNFNFVLILRFEFNYVSYQSDSQLNEITVIGLGTLKFKH